MVDARNSSLLFFLTHGKYKISLMIEATASYILALGIKICNWWIISAGRSNFALVFLNSSFLKLYSLTISKSYSRQRKALSWKKSVSEISACIAVKSVSISISASFMFNLYEPAIDRVCW